EFRATAEARKRPALLAEAMVDADVEVPGIVEKGKLLTLSTDEALQHKIADFRADTIEAVLEQLGLAAAQVRPAAPHWAELLVRFLTHPIVSSLLISMGMIGIIVELRTPGFGIAGGVGVGNARVEESSGEGMTGGLSGLCIAGGVGVRGTGSRFFAGGLGLSSGVTA
ncbi:MAG: nodulation protein NfeD, partial [Candidatus Brocadiae bacterium]|nr:nodulation protein NfeD [Candidatus Brocadiia bacterium]